MIRYTETDKLLYDAVKHVCDRWRVGNQHRVVCDWTIGVDFTARVWVDGHLIETTISELDTLHSAAVAIAFATSAELSAYGYSASVGTCSGGKPCVTVSSAHGPLWVTVEHPLQTTSAGTSPVVRLGLDDSAAIADLDPGSVAIIPGQTTWSGTRSVQETTAVFDRSIESRHGVKDYQILIESSAAMRIAHDVESFLSSPPAITSAGMHGLAVQRVEALGDASAALGLAWKPRAALTCSIGFVTVTRRAVNVIEHVEASNKREP